MFAKCRAATVVRGGGNHVGRLGHRHHVGLLRVGVRARPLVRSDMTIADILELGIGAALLVYLVYVLIRPERF
jgi:K+-transporting ATPase KdpF subunit